MSEHIRMPRSFQKAISPDFAKASVNFGHWQVRRSGAGFEGSWDTATAFHRRPRPVSEDGHDDED